MIARERKPLPRASKAKAPWAFLVTVALVAGVEAFAVRPDYALRSYHATSWGSTAEHLNQRVGSPDVLCFGDSLVKFGVFPGVIEEVTGRKAFNLALTCGPAPASYVLLRRALGRGLRPAVVLVDFDADILREGPRSVKRPYPWADLLTPAEALELSREARDPDLFVRVALNNVLHALKNRPEIRQQVVTTLRGEESWLRQNLPGMLRNWNTNAGAQVNGKWSFQEAPPPGPKNLPDRPWSADPVNGRYVERFLDLAERHGAAVFWVIPPFSPMLERHARYRGDSEGFDRFVAGVRARHPRLVVLDGRGSGYDRTVFIDPAHLDRDGASAFSAALGDCVNGYLADPTAYPRLVALPPYRPVPFGRSLEDVAASTALARAGLVGRAAARR